MSLEILRNALCAIQEPTIQLCWQDNSLSQSLSSSRGTNRSQKIIQEKYGKWAMRKHNRMHCSIPSTNHKRQNMYRRIHVAYYPTSNLPLGYNLCKCAKWIMCQNVIFFPFFVCLFVCFFQFLLVNNNIHHQSLVSWVG